MNGKTRKLLQRKLLKIFDQHHNKDINPYYIDRSDRNRFAAGQLQTPTVKRILNLGGGGKRHLESNLSQADVEVFEVDMQGNCDLQVNLDTVSKLPFEDCSFDVACSFDVLEHLENFHLINDEMYRVAREFILISLPNSAAELPFNFLFNKANAYPYEESGVFSRYYGLPLQPPEDRHRWWLYFHDIIRFYYHFSLTHEASLEFWTPRLNFKKKLFKMIAGSHLYYGLFCPFVWIKISKNPERNRSNG